MHKLALFCLFSFMATVVNSKAMAQTPNENKEVLCFASDTQAPMWVETLWLRANNNRSATRKIFDDIRQKQPHTLFLLGDVVNLGYSNRQWKPMDVNLNTLRSSGVEVHAILGNHEVMGQPVVGEMKFQKRFPEHVRTGYVKVVDSVAVILLNSNFSTLSKKDNEQQLEWYQKTLESLDADSSVQFIITTCHHSPFTNSKVVGPNATVQQKIVPYFLRSKKSQLFLSGHSHNFERFQVGGKDFMVIGGGGGLHQPLRKGLGVLPDLCPEYKPMFHYLTVQRENGALKITSHQLSNGFQSFEDGVSFVIRPHADAAVADVR